MNVPIKVVSIDEFRAARAALPRPDWAKAAVERIAAEGFALFEWSASGISMSWECPGCGHIYSGNLGDQPVGGWDEPRWVNSGTTERPTLMPSLGCGRWRLGECTGHWWLRDGILEQA